MAEGGQERKGAKELFGFRINPRPRPVIHREDELALGGLTPPVPAPPRRSAWGCGSGGLVSGHTTVPAGSRRGHVVAGPGRASRPAFAIGLRGRCLSLTNAV